MKPSDLQKLDFDEFDESTRGQGKLTYKSISSIDPYIVYAMVKNWIGKPSTEFEENFDWIWFLKVSNFSVQILCEYEEIPEVSVYGKDDQQVNAEQIEKDLFSLFASEAPKYAQRLKSIDESKLAGFLLQNPFAVYFKSANNILEDAQKLGTPTTARWDNRDRIANLCRSAFFLYIASFEGFLNILYEIYLKPSLRDERIYSRLGREQIDIKLRLAPMYCNCFASDVIDHRNEEFQRFQFLVELRNDFVHANLTKTMRTPIIKEDGHKFQIAQTSEGKYGLSKNIDELDISNIEFVKETIEKMVNSVLQSMTPRFKYELSDVLHDEYIVVGVLEGEYVVNAD